MTTKKQFVLLAVYLVFQPFRYQAQAPCDYFPNLGEHTIVDNFIKDYAGANLEKNSFKSVIHYSVSGCNPTCTLTNSPVIIKLNALIDLFNKTKDLPADIRGMEIVLGLNGNKVVYYFSAVTMSYSASNDNYEITHVPDDENPQFYLYSPGSNTFTPLSESDEIDADKYKKEYADNIRIKHLPSDLTHGKLYNQDNTWRQDTRSVIFSFQEIFYLSQACFNCTDTENRSLYFYNGSWGYHEVNDPSEVRNKHNVFISCEPVPTSSPTYNLVANMAHLCPPSCDPNYETTTWGIFRINSTIKMKQHKKTVQLKKN